MKGGIYTDEICPLCGGRLVDNHRDALACLQHPQVKAGRLSVRFGKVHQRFRSYDDAFRFLTGVRFKTDEGSFCEGDYRHDRPFGFTNLYQKWVERKREDSRKPRYIKHLECVGRYASEKWDNRNIRDIVFADLDDLKFSIKRVAKTKENYIRTLRAFWTWAAKTTGVTIPDFPLDTPELGYRKTVDKETQIKILDEVRRISAYNPKIWLAIKFLCTYISVRPGEIVTLEEGNIDLGNGYIYFPHPKEKRFKSVPLIQEDVEILKSYPKSVKPDVRFFRHVKGSGFKEGTPFGQHVLANWWKKACANLGVVGVDMYGGTRHSSARALRARFSPEQIKRATMHSTSKAFERYFRVESDEVRNIYETGNELLTNKTSTKGCERCI